jgi:phosphoglycolate phosphatase-like HAD superfamily hydrolase
LKLDTLADFIELKVSENKFIVFDLDNTLFDERIWLLAAYRRIAEFAYPQKAEKKEDVYNFLRNTFDTEGRKFLLDKLKIKFPDSIGDIDLWLLLIRQTIVDGGLPIFDWAKDVISKFSENCIAILTNGNPLQQKKKFEQLYPSNLTKNLLLICANEVEPKPSPKGLFLIGDTFDLKMKDLVFVGDSQVDLECSMKAGVEFIQVHNYKK